MPAMPIIAITLFVGPLSLGAWLVATSWSMPSATSASQRGSEPVDNRPDAPNVIAGRVLDSEGRPVGDVAVTALVPTSSSPYGFRPVDVRMTSVTAADGAFRLDRLPLGRYYVIALPHNRQLTDPRQPRNGYANTFFPNATRVADAQVVLVTPTAQARADVTLAPAALATIRGGVTDSTGQPVRSGRLGLARGNGLFGIDSASLAIGPDGTFRTPPLPPGTYHLHYREGLWPPPRHETPKVSVAKVLLAGADVNDTRVVPVRMVRGLGRVIVDPATGAALEPSTVTIAATPLDSDGNPGPQRPGVLASDLTFELRTWPGDNIIRGSLPRGWVVKAVRHKNADISNQPIRFVEGQDISGLEIELVRR
jgi:hypothetical protein